MNKREPLVNPKCTNSRQNMNKFLPTRPWGSKDMDTTDPRKTTAMKVQQGERFYLDVGDNKREKD